MKGVIVILSLLVASVVPYSTVIVDDRAFSVVRNRCIAQTGVDPGRVHRMTENIFEDWDPLLQQYDLCIMYNYNIMDRFGVINPQAVYWFLVNVRQVSDEFIVREIMNRCLVTYPTPLQTAVEFPKCQYHLYHQHNPIFVV